MPNFDPPHGFDGLRQVYGDFKWTEQPAGFVDIDDTWEADNLVRIPVPGTALRIRLHHLVGPLFLEAWRVARERCPDYPILQVSGYVPRHMKRLNPADQAKAPLSTHAWGCAFDVNWDTNPLQPAGPDPMVSSLPEPFVRAFTEKGWTWGGTWRHLRDPMHFQYATGV